MSEAYKKFTAQDFAVVPANAHKQYKFNSQSANDNRVTWHSARWTSESVSLYTTSSGPYGGDTKNIIKYNQLDHLFYRNFKKSINDRLGYNNYLKQQRKLYQNVQILSIPAGLYGHEVKPGEFYISSSNYEIYDDTYGNLFISGTKFEFYPSDIRKNVFKLEPVNAFKAYDLDTIPGYAVKLTDLQDKSVGITKRFWRRGTEHPDATAYYNTPNNLTETDDSYYFNDFKYKNVNFEADKFLGPNGNHYSTIVFDSKVGSHIVSPHNEKFNFNDEDFSISFFIDPAPVGGKILNKSGSIGTKFAGGIIYHIDASFIYIIGSQAIGKLKKQLGQNVDYDWGVLGANANAGVGNVETGPSGTPKIGDGETQTVNMEQADGIPPNTKLGHLVRQKLSYNGYEDWYIPTVTEMYTADTNLKILDADGNHNEDFKEQLEEQMSFDGVDNELLTSTEDTLAIDNFVSYVSGSLTGNNIQKDISFNSNVPQTFFPVRKIPRGINSTYYGEKDDYIKRYIICKSGTQTVSPSDLNPGTQTSKNTAIPSSSQPLNVPSQPQFPFEIYMVSHSLCFERSDGKQSAKIEAILTGSSNHPEHHHVLCQKTGSRMQIYIDGKIVAEGSDSHLEETRNLANLYIGSKGMLSKPDANRDAGNIRFFNGQLTCLNIWNRSYNTASIINISESIDASPYIGNIFYQNGFATLTKPNVQDIDLPSLTIDAYQIGASNVIEERVKDYSYMNKEIFADLAVVQKAIALKDDGTRYYYISKRKGVGSTNAIMNNIDGYGGNGDKSLLHKHPMCIYQHELNTPFSFISQSKVGSNPSAPNDYLTGTTAHALGHTASYAVISSSFPYLFLDNVNDMVFHPSGTYLYLAAQGFDILSGSQHPTMDQMDTHFNTPNPSNPPHNYNNLDYWKRVAFDDPDSDQGTTFKNSTFWRFNGGIVQIPLATPWDISSGSVVNATNPAGTSSLEINNAYVHYTTYIKFANQIEENDTTPAQKYFKEGGENPRALAFNNDGTKVFTAHEVAKVRFDTGNTVSQFFGPDRYPNPNNLPSGPNTGLDSTYNIIEHNLSTPWDISTIDTTGEYWLDNSINTAEDPALVPTNAHSEKRRYRHAGKVLDLQSLISPEGYPIKVMSINFNKSGTRMFLVSEKSSISEPQGYKFHEGGWNPGNTFPVVNGWTPNLPTNDPALETQGTRLWEYELQVPFDILSAIYVKSTPLAQPGGILERSFPLNDDLIATDGVGGNGSNGPDYRFTDKDHGMQSLKFINNGGSYVFSNSRGRTLNKVSLIPQPKEYPFKVHFQGSHLIFEHEYQCTIDEYEFNDTLNISARKIRSQDSHELADFATGSLFKPYITSVGLYNENNELLVVGKLGQPLRASNETDTTIILRWDS